jgi:sodium pump decarboxylase gamma subunit
MVLPNALGGTGMLGDGLIILLVGMAITFTFLVLLWLLIRLIGLLDRRPKAAASAGCREPAVAAVLPATQEPGDERAVVAALAVAIALEEGGARVGAGPSTHAPQLAGWRMSARRALMAGPERVDTIRAGRPGGRP